MTLELAFADELSAVFDLIRCHPSAGSNRHAKYANDLPSPLRFLPLKRFERHLVYCIDLPEHVEVIRVWHAARGLSALMDNEE